MPCTGYEEKGRRKGGYGHYGRSHPLHQTATAYGMEGVEVFWSSGLEVIRRVSMTLGPAPIFSDLVQTKAERRLIAKKEADFWPPGLFGLYFN